jgi:putative transcriptional regulator
MTALQGKLLVATPALLDPNFYRSVVLVCEHNDEGAFGLILNRPIDVEVGEHLPGWAHLVSEPGRVFKGGPVSPAVAVALARHRGDAPAEGWTAVLDEVGLLDLESDPADLWSGLAGLRVFSGYAGWSAGQLEAEIEQEAWFVVDADPADAFTSDTDALWAGVLRRSAVRFRCSPRFPRIPR